MIRPPWWPYADLFCLKACKIPNWVQLQEPHTCRSVATVPIAAPSGPGPQLVMGCGPVCQAFCRVWGRYAGVALFYRNLTGLEIIQLLLRSSSVRLACFDPSLLACQDRPPEPTGLRQRWASRAKSAPVTVLPLPTSGSSLDSLPGPVAPVRELFRSSDLPGPDAFRILARHCRALRLCRLQKPF